MVVVWCWRTPESKCASFRQQGHDSKTWLQRNQVVLEKRPLNGWSSSSSSCIFRYFLGHSNVQWVVRLVYQSVDELLCFCATRLAITLTYRLVNGQRKTLALVLVSTLTLSIWLRAPCSSRSHSWWKNFTVYITVTSRFSPLPFFTIYTLTLLYLFFAF